MLVIEILLNVLLARSKKTPAFVVIALTVFIIGYTLVTIINKADFIK
jgi:hypothetical protein